MAPVIDNGPRQVEDGRGAMEAMAGALKAPGPGSMAALRWRAGLVGMPLWEGSRYIVAANPQMTSGWESRMENFSA